MISSEFYDHELRPNRLESLPSQSVLANVISKLNEDGKKMFIEYLCNHIILAISHVERFPHFTINYHKH